MGVTPDQRRRLDAFHRALGTFAAIWIFVLGLTGSVSLFRDQLDHWAQGPMSVAQGAVSGRAVEATARPASMQQGSANPVDRMIGLDDVLRALSQDLAAATRISVRYPAHSAEPFEVTATSERGLSQRYRVNSTTGDSLGAVRHEAALAYFTLHAYFLVSSKLGRYWVGAFGVMLVASALTGLVLQRRVVRAALRIRWSGRDRIVAGDLHRSMGVIALVFHVAMGATGACLGLKDLFVGPALVAQLGGDVRAALDSVRSSVPVTAATPADMPPLEPLVQRAAQAIPGFVPNLVILREWGRANALMQVLGTVPGKLLPRHEAEQVHIELGSGEVVKVEDGQRATWVMRAYYALAPIHYGDFFGVWVKWVYFVLGLSTAALGLTGVVIRRERQSERARAKSGTRRGGRSDNRSAA